MFKKLMMLGVAVIVFFTLAASLLPSAEAAWTIYHEQTNWSGVGQIRVAGEARFDGGRVYSNWRDCRVLWSTAGTRTDITWCGVYKNGSTDWMEVGANYTVHYYTPGGFEYYTRQGWMRTRVYTNGRVERYPY